jgi:hypothetical protein
LIAAAIQEKLAVFLKRIIGECAEAFFDLLMSLRENAQLGLGDFAVFGGFGLFLHDQVTGFGESGGVLICLRTCLGCRFTPASSFGQMKRGKTNSGQQGESEKNG